MEQDPGSTLDQAVKALRETVGPEALSPSSRTAILRRISEPDPSRAPLAVLFPTSWRVFLAGALPVAMALTVVLVAGRNRENRAVSSEPVVHKMNGRVFIEVAAGATVTKSSVPFVFDDRRAVLVQDGRYQDRSVGDSKLVFYRIE